jgi:hypothetical protein
MIYLAAVLIVMGVALFVAAPLFESARQGRAGRGDPDRARLEHERALAVQALRELEFDREMRKLSDADCAELKQRLEARALRAMAALEKLDQRDAARAPSGGRRRVARIGAASQAPSPIRFCPACGAAVAGKINFCAECGAALALREKSMTR